MAMVFLATGTFTTLLYTYLLTTSSAPENVFVSGLGCFDQMQNVPADFFLLLVKRVQKKSAI